MKLLDFTKKYFILIGLFYGVFLNANVTLTIVSPSDNAFVEDTVKITATIQSDYELSSVEASIETLKTILQYSSDAVSSKYGTSPGFSGSLPIGSLFPGSYVLTVTAKDMNGEIDTKQKIINIDNKPTLTISEPLNHTVAKSSLPVNISCSDDIDDCDITLSISGKSVATGINVLSKIIDLSEYNGKQITLSLQAKDSSNQTTTETRTIYVESSRYLTRVKDFSNEIIDFDGEKILMVNSGLNEDQLFINDIYYENKVEIPIINNKKIIINKTFLTPSGAIFQIDYAKYSEVNNVNHMNKIYDWNNNELLDKGYGNYLQADGNYAVWEYSYDFFMYDINLKYIVNFGRSSESYNFALSSKGIVGYEDHSGSSNDDILYSYEINDNITKVITDDQTTSVGNPKTDGNIFIYTKYKEKYKSSPTDYKLVIFKNGAETVLVDNYTYSDYQINNGWVAYTKLGTLGQKHIWTLSPDSTYSQRTFFGSSSTIDKLSSNGDVILSNNGKRYLSKVDGTLIDLESTLGKEYEFNNEWYITIGRSLFKIDTEAIDSKPTINSVNFTGTTQIGNSLTFTTTSKASEGKTIVSTLYDFENNGEWLELNTHTFSNEGIYTINVKVIDSKGDFDTTSLKVVITEKIIDKGNLIILTGDSDNPTDPLYAASQKLSLTFYNRFSQRGFDDEDIYWMNYNSVAHVDDINFSKNDFYSSITSWATNTQRTGPLYIYMVDHGANGSFKISSNDKNNDGQKEIVYASELVKEVEKFIASTNRDVYIFIEACKSGSFIPAFSNSSYANKMSLITSSEAGELSYIDQFGNVSFTKLIVDEMLRGKTIYSSYQDAKTKLNNLGGVYSKQVPMILAKTDELKNTVVGGNFNVASISFTSIDNVFIDSKENIAQIDLTTKNNIKIAAKVTSDSGIKKIWTTIIPPDFPLTITDDFVTPDLTPYTEELVYNATHEKYEISHTLASSTSYSGEYKITVYTEDNDGLVYSKTITVYGNGNEEYQIPENNTTEPTPLTKVLTINNGWNLVSLPVDINLSQADMSTKFPHATIIWKYKEDVWSAYSANSNVQDALTSKGVHPITSLSKAEGFWISNDGMEQVSFSGHAYETSVEILSSAWHLLGISSNISAHDIIGLNTHISIIWTYENGWRAYSPNSDIMSLITQAGITPLESIKEAQGFWVNVK